MIEIHWVMNDGLKSAADQVEICEVFMTGISESTLDLS